MFSTKNQIKMTDHEMEEEQTTMMLPTTIYFYRKVQGYGEYSYKLDQIVQKKERFAYPETFIQKTSLTTSSMTQLEIFNNIYIPEMNQKALQFAFRCEDGVYICSPTLYGKLQVISIKKSDYEIRNEECGSLLTSDLACSVYTIIHDYIETRGNKNTFYHVGASAFPCCGLFMPIWVSNQTLHGFLLEWNMSKLNTAKKESMVVVRCSTGLITVRKVLDTRQKWKPLNL